MKYFQDPTVPDRDKRKKVYYWEDGDKQISFLSRLRLDGLNQSQFHRALVDGYLKDDPDLLSYHNRYKEEHTVQGKNKRAKVERMKRDAADARKKFALDPNEIESIFDVIEKDGIV